MWVTKVNERHCVTTQHIIVTSQYTTFWWSVVIHPSPLGSAELASTEHLAGELVPWYSEYCPCGTVVLETVPVVRTVALDKLTNGLTPIESERHAQSTSKEIRLRGRGPKLWPLAPSLEGPAIRTAIVTKERCEPAGRELVSVRVQAGAKSVVPAWKYNCWG